ncbi:hypothetical protein [Novosphingobium sp. JCM 18896]|uniref:hypothetical protein n=1 Tax=Novosphingobium sp. JCM 18896 TaxID=2989731 RepID=UPI002221E6A5|nr:hypothetical protein [Novosphingobium sp. JCM 18896]MCW1430333.1 hypothetical protein [Novosphingobium sp. JCM 18896]
MRLLATLPLILLAACNGHGGSHDATSPADGSKATNYTGVGADETLHFTGTEPFWGGTVTGTTLTYETPEQPKGIAVTVHRFAGNNGLAFSGAIAGKPFDMAVTESACSDGMSDRSYPLSVTLQLGTEARQGCAWTDKRKFTGPAKP